jgi:hypothetical protein
MHFVTELLQSVNTHCCYGYMRSYNSDDFQDVSNQFVFVLETQMCFL